MLREEAGRNTKENYLPSNFLTSRENNSKMSYNKVKLQFTYKVQWTQKE